MSILACPKCHEPLEIEGKTCKCINNIVTILPVRGI